MRMHPKTTSAKPATGEAQDKLTSSRLADRLAKAHDASHYLLVPEEVSAPRTVDDVRTILSRARATGRPVTFRSAGTSLSGQGLTHSTLVDTRSAFKKVEVGPGGLTVRAQPGATVRAVNARLAGYGRKLGPDPASEVACTIGGVIANNSSGMACGTERNTYRTLRSMRFVLPSGTALDTQDPDADEQLRNAEPDLAAGLIEMRQQVLADPALESEIRRQYSMKNTMGYGLNSFLDFSRPIDILTHLIIGSEGTLAFVAEATFETVEVLPHTATGLMVFTTLESATEALPALAKRGFTTIELMDARSLRVAQGLKDGLDELDGLEVDQHAAFLVELQAATAPELQTVLAANTDLAQRYGLALPLDFHTDRKKREALWHIRKGLYTAVAGARPTGTSALLEDIAVPVDRLYQTCKDLTGILEAHGYEDSVIFGHAKDGNIHFMINERFDDPASLGRYREFTEEMVALVLEAGGSLKAEHGTGRIMAPFVRRQFGEELYEIMKRVKELCDPQGILNPGVVLSDSPDSYLNHLKTSPTVDPEVDRCVECGYCEPACPSRDLTLTPRQRIVMRREMQSARESGDTHTLRELEADFEYDGIQTCAVDGMCSVACPVDINTGDLIRRLRAEKSKPAEQRGWELASHGWGAITRAGSTALSAAQAMPALATASTRMLRTVAGPERIPLYSKELPKGGAPRAALDPGHSAGPDAVFFPACVGAMFGPDGASIGSSAAFVALCERAGFRIAIPERIDSLCCGTPWKSKGHLDGYRMMAEKTADALLRASDNGRLPIMVDASSCTEGLVELAQHSTAASQLRFVDAVEFTADMVLPRLSRTRSISSIAVHRTCSSTRLGINDKVSRIAEFLSDDVHDPIDWSCCAFAGDRGMLHPELTASATAAEAAELATRDFERYVSVNRTCELGMARATGEAYEHLLEVLEEATRPVPVPRSRE
ncbi:FAD-binding and (Fe-S)-binding domain-containing protein [Sinomonas sp. JGH33]|uniref:D-lactate dehydrogenase (cytochrome) n=1 Tax=Sinomonas terricola TaxID=3110330 RepID=A0ABU5TCP9_9MICC|nr:FAD-binding and (Fe-S)-binding domain-containing protein [Sinomonas sp. JGH33]MEA5457259.1 FAD-binding and (Fe-S)-binding domain-containing protein [Sinomonas sp. JGH33]